MSPRGRSIIRDFLFTLDTTYGSAVYAARKRVEDLLVAPPPVAAGGATFMATVQQQGPSDAQPAVTLPGVVAFDCEVGQDTTYLWCCARSNPA